MTYHAKVIAGGKVVIPADLRRELEIKDGDSIVFERDGAGAVTMRTFLQVVAEEQRKFRAMVGPDYSVDDFLADRVVDWPEA
ncbi:AbrB/MazE/SpoVT family DNA-binding domain-containing protein [uncultured Sphingomonas sp.]|uniref:AbrB/MazE/SpoVT family DNA-binding domain-containing protein n=1 Tax=uncultured Sphingomonas sp. TaxID=158754 RepID=UPI0035CBECEA